MTGKIERRVFPNAIIHDDYKDNITKVTDELVKQFSIEDLIIGSTPTYDPVDAVETPVI